MGSADKIWVVTKADADMGAPYVVGAFTDPAAVALACSGPGTFTIAACEPNRAYRQGTLLDVEVIENITMGSLRARP